MTKLPWLIPFPQLVCIITLLLAFGVKAHAGPDWQTWSKASFKQAAEQNKYVFLYLEANWCHWCHVMQKETLRDAAVLAELSKHYVTVRVDHDANPALANQYRNWGWPALIFLAADGTEIVKRAGYIDPDNFLRLLREIVKDPSPEPAAARPVVRSVEAVLDSSLKQALESRHLTSHDSEFGGLKLAQKFIDLDSVEYALYLARQGDQQQAKRVRKTLDSAIALIDPVWGGVYQYSTGGRWDRPHYEKIMRSQAKALRAYAMAYGQWQRPQDRRAAHAIRDYLLNFLQSPQGAFYVSQDADLVPGQKAHDYFALDDAGRRRQGMPRIDQHHYSLQNGLAIEALAQWFEVSGDQASLDAALRAAKWIRRNRQLETGGYGHGSTSPSDVYLEDNLAMARAFLQLYRATAELDWLQAAIELAAFIETHFRVDTGYSNAQLSHAPVALQPDIDVNLALARFLNLLAAYSGDTAHTEAARHAAAYLFAKPTALSRVTEPGLLLLAQEMAAAPLHLTVVGAKLDAAAAGLYAAAQAQPGWYKRLDWWDRQQGKLPNLDIEFPDLPRAAGYVCNGNRCSLPSLTAEEYRRRIHSLTDNQYE